MNPLSRAPNNNAERVERYRQRKLAAGETVSQEYIAMMMAEGDRDHEQDPEWAKDNMEYDLRTTDWILAKVRSSQVYAQNLYAAMCNNYFQKRDVMPILTDKTWSCTWRGSGRIVADMREEGDYLDWYCSGIIEDDIKGAPSYVSEGAVTEEIEADLLTLGWNVLGTSQVVI
jgi:hypothetical protein